METASLLVPIFLRLLSPVITERPYLCFLFPAGFYSAYVGGVEDFYPPLYYSTSTGQSVHELSTYGWPTLSSTICWHQASTPHIQLAGNEKKLDRPVLQAIATFCALCTTAALISCHSSLVRDFVMVGSQVRQTHGNCDVVCQSSCLAT